MRLKFDVTGDAQSLGTGALHLTLPQPAGVRISESRVTVASAAGAVGVARCVEAVRHGSESMERSTEVRAGAYRWKRRARVAAGDRAGFRRPTTERRPSNGPGCKLGRRVARFRTAPPIGSAQAARSPRRATAAGFDGGSRSACRRPIGARVVADGGPTCGGAAAGPRPNQCSCRLAHARSAISPPGRWSGSSLRKNFTPPQLVGSSTLCEIYWQIVLPGDRHIVRTPAQLAPVDPWQWLEVFSGRRVDDDASRARNLGRMRRSYLLLRPPKTFTCSAVSRPWRRSRC